MQSKATLKVLCSLQPTSQHAMEALSSLSLSQMKGLVPLHTAGMGLKLPRGLIGGKGRWKSVSFHFLSLSGCASTWLPCQVTHVSERRGRPLLSLSREKRIHRTPPSMKPLAYLMSPEKPPFPGSWRQQRHQFKTGSDQCFLHGKYRGIVTKQTTSVFISITLVSVLL